MKIEYDRKEDILYIRLTNEEIVEDISYGWNVNVGRTRSGIGEITILDAKAAGYWPPENVQEVLAAASA